MSGLQGLREEGFRATHPQDTGSNAQSLEPEGRALNLTERQDSLWASTQQALTLAWLPSCPAE